MGIRVGVRDEEFLSWLKITKNNFLAMTETMINVAEKIRDRVQTETVPIDTGRLSRSYKWTILTDNSRMKVLQVQMSALNPKTGFNYAYTQHLGYRESKRGRVWYNHGSIDVGFFNYSIWDGEFEKNNNFDVHHSQRGQSKYLYWAIVKEETSSFELIEKDYLSLFYGGHIV